MTCLDRDFDEGVTILETLFKACGMDVKFVRVYIPAVDDFEECLFTESWD